MPKLNLLVCATAFVFFVCTVASAGASDRLLPIPKWFPTEPGATIEYRCVDGRDVYVATVEVREVTHDATAYSMSARVTVRSNEDRKRVDEFQLDCTYKANRLTGTTVFANVAIDNLSPTSEAGDVMQIKGKSLEDQAEIAGAGKVVSTGTKVAIDGTRWDDAIVVVVDLVSPERDQLRFKFTLASPEGLIRASVANTRREATMELLSPRRPFAE